MSGSIPPTLESAKQLDQDDTLAEFRNMFHIPTLKSGQEFIYLCGNSCGLMPKSTNSHITKELEAWKDLAVEGHFKPDHDWFSFHENVTKPLAQITGSLETEVVAMNSLTTNLHLLMVSFFRPQGNKNKILIEKGAFPSDYYVVKSQLRFHGLDPDQHLIEIGPQNGEKLIDNEHLLAAIQENRDELALILLGGVQYLTGQLFDLAAIAKAANNENVMIGLDLAHAAGNIPLKLHDWGIDFAAWCHYKYLNGGPGTIGGAFIHEKHHQNNDIPRFEGWWGNNKNNRFEMRPDFDPIHSAEAWQLSNPPIFQLAALEASLAIFAKAGMDKLREKSSKLTSFLQDCIESSTRGKTTIVTPTNPQHRGAQLSLEVHNLKREFVDTMRDHKVICDFREPNIVRVAPTPLYNSFTDVFKFSQILGSLYE